MSYVLASVFALAGGFVQTVTGFGSGIVMMIFFPSLMPVLSAASASSAISLALNGGSTLVFRKHIRWRMILLPAVVYCLSAGITLRLAGDIDASLVLKIFGGFLVALSLYFLLFSDKLKVKATPAAACVCAMLSGVSSALFGIGGPPMVVYYLAALREKEEYLGTLQAYFFLTGIYTLVLRIIMGYYTLDLLPVTLLGIAAILLGMAIGKRVVDRIRVDTMRKLVYLLLGVTGIINLLS